MNKYQDFLNMFNTPYDSEQEQSEDNVIYVKPGETFNGYTYDQIVKMSQEKKPFYVQLKTDRKQQKHSRTLYTRTQITDFWDMKKIENKNNKSTQRQEKTNDEDVYIKIVI